MKNNVNESDIWPNRWLQNVRLWFCEMRLRFDLRYSRDFKKLCEKRNCPNLAGLEEQYIQKVQDEVTSIQQRRMALKEKSETSLTMPARARSSRARGQQREIAHVQPTP